MDISYNVNILQDGGKKADIFLRKLMDFIISYRNFNGFENLFELLIK